LVRLLLVRLQLVFVELVRQLLVRVELVRQLLVRVELVRQQLVRRLGQVTSMTPGSRRRADGGAGMRVKVYVAAVAVLAAGTAVAAGLTVPASHHVALASALAMLALITASEYLQVRYYHHDDVDALNLMEGLIAPLAFVASG